MRRAILTAAIAVALSVPGWAWAADRGLIFGTITTEWGDEYTGRIRWDKNEGCWEDILDGTKEDFDRYHARRSRPSKRISVFGVRVYEENDGDDYSSASSQLRFGHIAEIRPRHDGAEVRLKSGETVNFDGSGTDVGSSNRGIEIDAGPDDGVVELTWDDIEKVVFSAEPDDYKPSEQAVERLWGKVTSEDGRQFEGFVSWDTDEIFTGDRLDGEQDGHERSIPFGRIVKIERMGHRGSRVTLTTGRGMRLSGTNDVDEGHRGVTVGVAGMGRVEIPWDEFEAVEFAPIPADKMPRYANFDGGKRLRGTVTAGWDEDTVTGEIAWDNDERYTWEYLNGDYRGLSYDIELGDVASLERKSRTVCRVTLTNGTTLDLRGSNDVDDGNRGIFVESESGHVEEFEWDEVQKVTMNQP